MERLKKLGLAELKLLAHPLRQRILLAFRFAGVGLSAQQLAHRLGVAHGKVYYHVQRLVSAGLLEQTGERMINGIVEKLYLPAAQGFVADDEGLRGLPGYEAASQAVVENTLSEVLAVFREFGEQQQAALRTQAKPPGLIAGFSHLWLTTDEQEQLVEQVETLMRPFEAASEQDKASNDSGGGNDSRPGQEKRPVQVVWLWFRGLPAAADAVGEANAQTPRPTDRG